MKNLKTVVFPGQGSQKKGMGAELFKKYENYINDAAYVWVNGSTIGWFRFCDRSSGDCNGTEEVGTSHVEGFSVLAVGICADTDRHIIAAIGKIISL